MNSLSLSSAKPGMPVAVRLAVRQAIWAVLTFGLLFGQQWFLEVYAATHAAALGVAQLPGSDQASEAVRTFELLKNALPMGVTLLVLLLAWLIWGSLSVRLLTRGRGGERHA